MLAQFMGFSIRLWYSTMDPDNNVYTAASATPDIGEFFLNTTTGELFICHQNGVNNQLWQTTTNRSVIDEIISEITQSDWDQTDESAPDFIRNKPEIPEQQIQSDWSQENEEELDFIMNKPALSAVALSGLYEDLEGRPDIPSSQVQADWQQSLESEIDFIKNKPVLSTVATSGNYQDLSGLPTIPTEQIQSDWIQTDPSSKDFIKNKPIIPQPQLQADWQQTLESSSDFIRNKPTIPSPQIQSDWAQTNISSLDFIKNKPAIPSAQIQSDWSQTNSSALDFVRNKPLARNQSLTPRSLNSIFQVSATRDALLNYSVDITCSLSLLVGQAGICYLEISPAANFSSGVQEVCRFTNSNTGALAVGLSLTQTNTARLSGYLPVGWYARIRTENVTGTPTFTYRSGQEVLL